MMPGNMSWVKDDAEWAFSVVKGSHAQTEPFKDKRLIKKSDQYQIVTYGHKSGKYDAALVGTPKGQYDFVILPASPDACYVRRNREDRMLKYRNTSHHDQIVNRGHMSIAQGSDVYFAGSIWFGGGPLTRDYPDGQLMKWENSSGHYQVGKGMTGQDLISLVARQTRFLKCADGSRLLPMDKFKAWSGEIL